MELGAIAKAHDIGYRAYFKYIWAACIDCGKERWVLLRKGIPDSLRCRSCGNKGKRHTPKNTNWKAGISRRKSGYVAVWLQPTDFFYSMCFQRGYVLEHRLVMAKSLGRCLQPWEIVHHKNGIKDDNRIENLQLVSDDRHKQISILERRIKRLEQRVTFLEAENELLKVQQFIS